MIECCCGWFGDLAAAGQQPHAVRQGCHPPWEVLCRANMSMARSFGSNWALPAPPLTSPIIISSTTAAVPSLTLAGSSNVDVISPPAGGAAGCVQRVVAKVDANCATRRQLALARAQRLQLHSTLPTSLPTTLARRPRGVGHAAVHAVACCGQHAAHL